MPLATVTERLPRCGRRAGPEHPALSEPPAASLLQEARQPPAPGVYDLIHASPSRAECFRDRWSVERGIWQYMGCKANDSRSYIRRCMGCCTSLTLSLFFVLSF